MEGKMSISAAAQHVGLSHMTLLRAAKRGEFEVTRFTPKGTIFVDPADVVAWIERRTGTLTSV